MSDTSFLQTVKTLKPYEITGDMLIVDIRPKLDYNNSHYNGAISLCFPQILFRRLIRKKNEPMILNDFLLGDIQELKKRHTGTFIVLYDYSSTDINTCTCNSECQIAYTLSSRYLTFCIICYWICYVGYILVYEKVDILDNLYRNY